MTEKELNIVFNCLKDEEELEFETVGKMYNYIRKLEAEIERLQNTSFNSEYKQCRGIVLERGIPLHCEGCSCDK